MLLFVWLIPASWVRCSIACCLANKGVSISTHEPSSGITEGGEGGKKKKPNKQKKPHPHTHTHNSSPSTLPAQHVQQIQQAESGKRTFSLDFNQQLSGEKEARLSPQTTKHSQHDCLFSIYWGIAELCLGQVLTHQLLMWPAGVKQAPTHWGIFNFLQWGAAL